MFYVLKLSRDFILAFNKTQGTFTEIVGCWDPEIIELRSVVLLEFFEPDLEGIFKLSEVASAVLEILFISRSQKGIISV